MNENFDLSIDKELYIFELDNVLFPKRDYLAQVYYLFGSFYEFNEGSTKTNDLAQFMTKVYDIHGEEAVFTATKTMFNIDDKYEDNFNRLMANAQLPLKLEIYPEIKAKLTKLIEHGKNIAILTEGNPVEQLNKLKFIDWQGLEELKSSLKVYFMDELNFRSIKPLEYIASEYNLELNNLVYLKP